MGRLPQRPISWSDESRSYRQAVSYACWILKNMTLVWRLLARARHRSVSNNTRLSIVLLLVLNPDCTVVMWPPDSRNHISILLTIFSRSFKRVDVRDMGL